jgi:hypothetical protein
VGARAIARAPFYARIVAMVTSGHAYPRFATALGALTLSAAVFAAGPAATPTKPAQTTLAAVSEAEVSSGTPLHEVPDPSHALARSVVQTSKGEKIGEVEAVELGRDGKVKSVKVATTGMLGLGTLTKSIGASDLIYVKQRNILVSRLTKREINALPASRKKKS